MATNVLLAGGLQSETRAVLARSTAGLVQSDTILRADRAIRDLKAAGLFYLLDGLYILATDNTTLARLNWVQNAYNLTAVNSPAFVANRGYTSDGATSYLDTNCAINTAGLRYQRNSASVFYYSGTDALNGAFDIGQNGGGGTTYVRFSGRSTSANAGRGQINDNTTRNVTSANSTSLGLFQVNRSGASATQVYQNGVQLLSDATASVALGVPTLCFCANPDQPSYSPRQIRLAAFGSSFTAAQGAEFLRIVKNILGPIGAI